MEPGLAYASDESGRLETYVQPFPFGGAKWQVSTDGGTEPLWSPAGPELFYRNGAKVMVVPIQTRPTFAAERPKVLFEGRYAVEQGYGSPSYDVAPDASRFLMMKPVEEPAAAELRVVLNWGEELRAKFPSAEQ